MVANTTIGKRYPDRPDEKVDISFAISNALGLEAGSFASLNETFRQGMGPVVNGLKEGDLSEEQASLLIELLLAGYIGAAINEHIDSAFRSWAERMLATHLGEQSERR